ncbi:MAG: GNAT family N-acetyltransferase [Alphaproteobacteria bacterium]
MLPPTIASAGSTSAQGWDASIAPAQPGPASGGASDWRAYRGEDEIAAFHGLARGISARSWQERRLDAGLPGGADFLDGLRERARRDAVRGYLLFLGTRPVAYMLCPVDDGILRNAHVGFDPDAAALSPGAVLQWLVLAALLEEGRHRLFDFTPGDGQHKRLFATRSVACADAMLLRPSPRVLAVIAAQRGCDLASSGGAALLRSLGLLAPMRILLRR